MKYLIIAILFFSCVRPTVENKTATADTVKVEVVKIDSLAVHQRDSLKIVCDSLKTQLFLTKYKVEKVKFYLSICTRDKTQDKFLKGWVRRAIE